MSAEPRNRARIFTGHTQTRIFILRSRARGVACPPADCDANTLGYAEQLRGASDDPNAG